jgi:hypothetical protein
LCDPDLGHDDHVHHHYRVWLLLQLSCASHAEGLLDSFDRSRKVCIDDARDSGVDEIYDWYELN